MSEMTTKDYLEIKGRMTKLCGISCSDCPLSTDNNKRNVDCGAFEPNYPDEAIIIVEKWGKEHPIESNLTHYAKALRSIGYVAEEDKLKTECPVPFATTFGGDRPCPSSSCNECKQWWDEEYKGENNG